MCYKLILLFIFFEITVLYTTAENVYHNEMRTFQKIEPNDASFVLINPRQIQYAEVIIKHFLTRLAGPIVQPITLKLSSSNGSGLHHTISEISKIIRAKIMDFARAIGLSTSLRQYEQTLWNSTISKNWFIESLIQGSLLLSDLIALGQEAQFAIDHYFKTYNIILDTDKKISPRKITKDFKFFSTINDAAKFSEKLFKCLLPIRDTKNTTLSFNLHRILVNLAKDSPDNSVKLFKSNLDRAFFRFVPNNNTTSEQLHIVLCHSLIKRINHYDDCIKELQHFVTCVSSKNQEDLNKVMFHHRLFAKPWSTVIEDLSDCKIHIDEDGSTIVRCKFYRKLPKTTTRQVKYIYENILNQRISRRSSLYPIANKLGNVLSRSRWGRQLTYDICQYFAIYQEGQKRLNALLKNASKNKKTALRYKKMSVSLDTYKNGVLKEAMITIGNFHRSSLEMQKFFIYGIRNSFKESWQSHLKIFNCLSKWMMKLLELFGCVTSDDTDADASNFTDVSPINMTDSISDEIDENNEMKYLITYRKEDQIRKESDIAFQRLMHSMNDVSKMKSQNNKSTLACLANNLLLVTIFMETISFVSTLFCLGEHKDESNVEELKEEWNSPERERRSLFLKDFAEIDIFKKISSEILDDAFEKITDIYREDYVNSVENKFIHGINNSYLITTTLKNDK
ncbi:uncharacterized protein LOC105424737 [Pogonomyrmex barbatus]|uniref:Uncharacterized protein LOC105424737 n=1 Tax=Pogonomyrmex barbatus TaxID=144034 RepID=A0A6I9W125_9HYME|nr:uncharacterized protein LOC105424737 [Pogonomyrmex barbatus]